MDNSTYKRLAIGALAFLSAWQATNFGLDYREVLGAIVSAGLGYYVPKKAK